MNWKKSVAEFKSGLAIEPAKISAQAIRFGFFGLVGSGKSVTSGIFAVGITPTGKVGWIDGEGKRAGWAIDIVADMAVKHYGGTKASWIDRFVVVNIDPPFNPLRVLAAIELLEEQGCPTIILDVLTQAWDSDGGYLDLKEDELTRMAGTDENKRERSLAAAAAHVKPWTHGKLVNKINASRSNLVLVFQAKAKWNFQTKRPDEYDTPIQESGLTRTAIAVGRVEAREVSGQMQGGFCSFAGGQREGLKTTHPSIAAALPPNGEQFKFEHAEAIAKLCGIRHGAAPAKKQQSPINRLKADLWAISEPIHHGDKAALQHYCWDENLLAPEQMIGDLDEDKLKELYMAISHKLDPVIP